MNGSDCYYLQQNSMKKEQTTLLGVQASKKTNFSRWYHEVLFKSGMIDFYDVSGCYILKPWAFEIWQRIRVYFDALIKDNGVEAAYFPMFVTEKALQAEKDHVQGFFPEVAWATRSGKSELNEPIAIRPTSQTIIYPAYSRWIKSHRDLPLKTNQWVNVVRWEFKHPMPFIRSRQFLWQEGHTAHATFEEAEREMFDNLEFYERTYKQVLAVPMCKGFKTEKEKFPGGYRTSTVETWIPENGRAVQSATSHNLGQNFAKMFNIEFENEKKERKHVWQTSWGISIRSIGVMIMYHGDDKGLVLPPRVAAVQVVIIPILFKGKGQAITEAANEISTKLKQAGIRVKLDARDNYNPGWKFNHWQVKGVPLRIELGPKDLENKEVRVVVRHNGNKLQLTWDELDKKVQALLEQIHTDMYDKAFHRFTEMQKKADTWEEFMVHLNSKNVVLTPWCNQEECEQKVGIRSGAESKEQAAQTQLQLTGQAKSLCIPLEYEALTEGQKCFACENGAKVKVFWGRSY